MKTVTIIPKFTAVDTSGAKYSPHGSILPGSTIEKTSLFTWELNHNGSITYGLGRQPAKTIEEAVEVARSLEKLGYEYKGIRE